MSIRVNWLDESRSVILCVFNGVWTWDEFRHAIDDAARLFQEGSGRVSILVDFTRTAAMPQGNPFAYARRAFGMFDCQPNFSGVAVVVTRLTFIMMLSRVLISTGVAPGLTLAATREEALALLLREQADV